MFEILFVRRWLSLRQNWWKELIGSFRAFQRSLNGTISSIERRESFRASLYRTQPNSTSSTRSDHIAAIGLFPEKLLSLSNEVYNWHARRPQFVLRWGGLLFFWLFPQLLHFDQSAHSVTFPINNVSAFYVKTLLFCDFPAQSMFESRAAFEAAFILH